MLSRRRFAPHLKMRVRRQATVPHHNTHLTTGKQRQFCWRTKKPSTNYFFERNIRIKAKEKYEVAKIIEDKIASMYLDS
jgi:hypothetical protein